MKQFLSLLFCLTFVISVAVAVEVDCENPESINEAHIHLCCKHPDGHNDILDSCAKQTGFKLPNAKEQAIVDITADQAFAGTCFGKCVFDKLQFMKDNELDMEAVKKYYTTTHANDPEYAKEMINAFDHCHGQAEENTAKFMENPVFKDMKKEFCSPKPSVTWACVIREFFHNCPSSRWSKTDECQKTLEFSKKCKTGLTSI